MISYSILPVEGSDFTIEYGDKEGVAERQGWGEEPRGQWNVIEIPQGKVWWKEYPFLIPMIVISSLFLIGGGIFAYFRWKKKKNQKKSLLREETKN